MTRILYIYSKLNPKVQYVQGMNEILAPIFYLVNISKPADQIEESACFFMFNNAICDILEMHIKDLDKSRNGIYGKLNEVNEMLMVSQLTHRSLIKKYGCALTLSKLTHSSIVFDGWLYSTHRILSSLTLCASGKAYFRLQIAVFIWISLP